MRSTSRLLNPILKRSSYYESDYRQSPALIRARRPYIFKNLLTGAVIMTFAVSVFAFTIKAVGQEDFSDVVVPEEPVTSRQKMAAQVQGQGQGQGQQQQGFVQPPKTPNVQTNGVR